MPRHLLLILCLLFALPLAGLATDEEPNASSDNDEAVGQQEAEAPTRSAATPDYDPRDVQLDRANSFLGGPFGVDLRAGYSGTMWTPKGIGEYQVKTYGRNMLYAELAIHHPLLIINEAMDIIELPRLRVETNFGYSTRSAGFTDLVPEMLRSNPYLRTTAWMTMWQFVSFRYREERFNSTLENPNVVANTLNVQYVYGSLEMTNKVRDLEFGLIGSPDGEIHDTMIELGYYRSRFAWPLVQKTQVDEQLIHVLTQADYVVQGVYASLNTTPIKGQWPMYSQLMVRVGDSFGFDARIKAEREVMGPWFVGLELDASWRILNHYETEFEDAVEVKGSDQPRDTRYRLTLYTRWSPF